MHNLDRLIHFFLAPVAEMRFQRQQKLGVVILLIHGVEYLLHLQDGVDVDVGKKVKTAACVAAAA